MWSHFSRPISWGRRRHLPRFKIFMRELLKTGGFKTKGHRHTDPGARLRRLWRLRLATDARGCTELGLAPPLSAPHTLTREHLSTRRPRAPPVAPSAGCSIAETAPPAAASWFQTLAEALNRVLRRLRARTRSQACHEYLSTMRVWKSCEGVAEQWQ